MRGFGLTAAAAGLALAIAGCSKSETSKSESQGEAAESQAPATPAASTPAASPADRQAALTALPAPYNTADLTNGEAKFAMCKSCHTIAAGGANMTGPNLHGIFGKKAGQVANYNYSDAIKASDIVWDASQLDQWLANPRTYLPGTKMTFVGLKDEKDRKDLIAYVMIEAGYKAP